jgi:hypothetical protein
MNFLNRKITSVLCVWACLICSPPASAQTKKRLIPFPAWSLDVYDDEVSLELVEIKIAAKPISLDKPFEANENWLKNMTLQVKNVGTRPIVAFGIGGGLLTRTDEELPAYASFEYGIGWTWGKQFDPDKEKAKGPTLKPGEIVELSYRNVDSLTRRVLAKPGEGAFCKLKFMAPGIQYADGTSVGIGARMRFDKTL